MKKVIKHFLLIFTGIILLQSKNVYATETYVGSNEMYHSLDDIFSAMEEYGPPQDGYLDIYLIDQKTYTISSNYNINIQFNLYTDFSGNLTIEGNDHTITNSERISIDADSITLKNIDFISKNFNDENVENSFINLYSTSITIDSVTITNKDRLVYGDYLAALSYESNYLNITNTIISNYDTAIHPYGIGNAAGRIIEGYNGGFNGNNIIELGGSSTEIEIDASDLSNNAYSIYGACRGIISNTKLSSICLEHDNSYLELQDTNDYGDAKIIRIDNDYYLEDLDREIFENSIAKKNIYIQTIEGATIDLYVKKKEEVNIDNTKKVNLLEYFVDLDEINIRNYSFTVSDETIAKVENGEVIFLKPGEVEVIATNTNTNESYTLHLVLASQKESSNSNATNPKTMNSLYILLLLAILTVGSLFLFHKTQECTI